MSEHHRFCPMCGCECATAKDLAASQFRNRELTRQVEQLQAQVDAVRELIEDWRGTAENFDDEEIGEQYSDMADAVEAALTAPPSSSDPGRADTGREER